MGTTRSTSSNTSPSYLLQGASSYIFRYCLPKDIIPFIGKREFRYSVHTGTLSLARSRARYLAGQVQMIIRNIRQGGELTKLTKDQLNVLVGDTIRKFLEMDNHNGSGTQVPLWGNDHEIPPRSKHVDEYKALQLEIQKVHAQLAKVLSDGPNGTRSISHVKSQDKTPEGPCISDTLKDYKEEGFKSNRWNEKTFLAIESTVKLFIEVLGKDVPISEVTTPDVSKFFKVLQRYPSNVTKLKKYKGKPIDKILEIAERDNHPTLSINSINDHMSRLSGLFSYGKMHGIYVGDNPVSGMRLAKDKRNDEARDIFDKDDLHKLFHSEEYLNDAFDKPFKYWVPILGLYTGARINEICQLHLEDIRQEDGVWVLDLNEKHEKRLKNKSSKRLIPLHTFIIEDLRFIDFVCRLKSQGETRLFPELTLKRDGYATSVSRWFSRYRDECGIQAPPRTKSFHSFRHTFDTNLKYSSVDGVMCNELMGHAVEGMRGIYQKRYPVSLLLKDGCMKLDYGVDLSHLKNSRYAVG